MIWLQQGCQLMWYTNISKFAYITNICVYCTAVQYICTHFCARFREIAKNQSQDHEITRVAIHFCGICKNTFLWHKLWFSFKSTPKNSVVNPLHELIFYRDVSIGFYLNVIFCNNWLSFRHRFDDIFSLCWRKIYLYMLHHGLSFRCISIWIIGLL